LLGVFFFVDVKAKNFFHIFENQLLKPCYAHTHTHFSLKNLFCFLLIMLVTVGYSQNPQNKHITPNGVLDAIFDKQGNKYTFNDILINTDNNQSYNRVALLGCSTNSIFNLYFETGCGLDNIASQIDNDRRAVICQVFEDLSAFITTTNSALQPTSTTKVNIWVRNINNIPNANNSVLGVASGFYNMPSNNSIGGITDNEIWKTIHAGVDSYANVVAPLVSNGGSSNANGIFYHGYMAYNFNPTNTTTGFTAYNWNLDTSNPATSTQIDLYSIVLHEMLHALGFNSLVNANGTSQFGSNYKYFSRYDQFLKNNSNVALLTTSSSSLLYNQSFNSLLNTNILRPGCSIPGNINSGNSIDTTLCNDALKFVGSNGIVPVYTPTCFENGSSLSHFEDEIYPTCSSHYPDNSYFVMSNANYSGATKRYIKPEERAALCDIGYSVNTSFGVSGAKIDGNNTFYNYQNTSVCNGITVAGINDGKNPNNTYTYIGNAGSNITINAANILLNDFNATEFIGLEDLTASSSITPTSGNSSTNIVFTSSLAGVHLLRYIPKNGNELGNITYIYVYVQPIINYASGQLGLTDCNPIPNACDLVMNGDFEQKSSLPDNLSQINKACGWWDDLMFGTDYFHTNLPFSPTFTPLIPCSLIGKQNITLAGSSAHSGFLTQNNIINPLLNQYEILKTKLSTPLIAGVEYQLSFNVSKAENTSANVIKIQAFLSSNNIPFPTSGNLDISNGIFYENSYYTTNYNDNLWDTFVFNFTSPTGGEQFLYIGGLNNVQFSLQPAVSSPSNGCTFSNLNNVSNGNLYSYYFVDNVSLIPTNGAEFNLPTNIACGDPIISNLATFLNAVPLSGSFSGQGVTFDGSTYSFSPALSGIGNIAITYTYTNSSVCPVSLIKNIIVSTPSIVPTFPAVTAICNGAAYVLPTTSNNGFTGTWSPAFNNLATTTYTFTPSINSCAIATTLTIPVNTSINAAIPTFNAIAPICVGDVFSLPSISNNGFLGTWSPAINNTQTTTYTFTPDNGQCAKKATLTVVVNNASVTITGSNSVCRNSGETYSASINGGIWLSSDVSIADIEPTTGELFINQSGTFEVLYLLTVGSCSSMTSYVVTIVEPDTPPLFSFQTTICLGGIRPHLPNFSDDGIHGNWVPDTVDNSATSNYTFYPDNNCTNPFTQIVTVINGGSLVANQDTMFLPYSSTGFLSPNILLNDTFNGNPFTSNSLGLNIVLVTTTNNITINQDGTLNIPPDLPIGIYTVEYFLENDCLQSNIIRVDITIYDATITADEKTEINVCYAQNAYTTSESIFEKVSIGGLRADATTIDINNLTTPSGFSLNTDGTINVPANTLPGTYNFNYNLCPAGSSSGCVNDITFQVIVNTTVRANPDIFYFDTDGNFIGSNNSTNTNNILTNDGYAQDCGFSAPNSFGPVVLGGNISNLIITPLGSTSSFFSFSPGGIVIPNLGIQPGNYHFKYTICDFNYQNVICSTINSWIAVIPPSARFLINNNETKRLENEKISVIPNPSDGIFFISFDNNLNEELSVSIYNLIGQLIFSDNKVNENKYEINLSNYSKGTYLLKILYHDKTVIKKIILK